MSPGLLASRTAALVDGFGRIHTDLRISLTDRCNLRCTYCMPAEGLDWMPSADLLSDDELLRIARVCVERLGVTSIRLTGGEPLVRRGVVALIGQLAALSPRPELSMTTNGIGLARTAKALRDAGLDRINVSLDTLHRDRFTALARRDRIDDVMAGLSAATAAGLTPVKVNAVIMRGCNDDEVGDLLDFCLTHGYELRIIEQMPLDAQHGWNREAMVTADEVIAQISKRHQLTAIGNGGHDPAVRYLVDDGPGTVGIIASVSRPFCGSCDRLRLTADGQIRNCLFARDESDLRAPLRAGADDGEIAARIRSAIAAKRAGHGIDDPTFVQPDRPMSAIGG